MAKLKKPRRTSVRSRVPLPAEAMLLTRALDMTARTMADMTASERAAALALRRESGCACVGGPFDPRHVLTLTSAALAEWRARRLAFLGGRLAAGGE